MLKSKRTITYLLLLFLPVFLLTTAKAHADTGVMVVTSNKQSGTTLTLQTSISQSADFTMLPSVTTTRAGAGEQNLNLNVACVLLPFNVIVPDCDIRINWLVRSGTGGHVHNTSRPPGRIRTERGQTGGSITPGPAGQVSGNSGDDALLGIRYTSPEASGETRVTLRGVATVFGIPVNFGPNTFTIGVEHGDLSRVTSVAGLSIASYSNMHNGHNGHGTSSMNTSLPNIPTNFARQLVQLGTPANQVPTMTISAISLPQGGLFDYQNEWLPPHRTHRVGGEADLALNNVTLTQTQLRALARSVRQSGFSMPVRSESPAAPGVNHWHLVAP